MSFSITYPKHKINIILPSTGIAAIMLTSESQTAFPAALARMLSGFEEVILILISAFYASINQPFSESCGFLSRKRLSASVFLSAPALLPVFRGQWCSFACRNVSLILIYRHRVKSVCKSLNSPGELSLC